MIMVKMLVKNSLLIVLCFVASWTTAQTVSINYSDASGNTGDVVDVNITFSGFNNIKNFNFWTLWDADKFEFVELTNITTVLPANDLTFGTPITSGQPGRLTAVFFRTDTTTYNLSNTDIFATIKLRIKTTLATSGKVTLQTTIPQPAFFARVNGSDVRLTVTSNDGTITANGGGTGSDDFTLEVLDAEAQPNGDVCLIIQAQDAVDLAAISNLGVTFDPNVLMYSSSQMLINRWDLLVLDTNVNTAGYFQLNPTANATEYVNGEVDMMSICFKVIGSCDETTVVTLSKPNRFLCVDKDLNVLDPAVKSGVFTVNCNLCDVNPTITDVSCNGGQDGLIDLDLAGCPNVTSIQWVNNATGQNLGTSETQGALAAGSYKVTVVYQNGAETVVEDNIIVGEPALIQAQGVQINEEVNGNDGSINLTIIGGTQPYTFNWSNGAQTEDVNNLTSGSYTLTVTDNNNCTRTFGPYTIGGSFAVTGQVSNVACFGENNGAIDITVTGGSGNYTYQWTCDGTAVTPDVNGDLSGLSGGTCTVQVTDIEENMIANGVFEVMAPDSELNVEAISTTADCSDGNNGLARAEVTGGVAPYSYSWNTSPVQTGVEASGLPVGRQTVLVTDFLGCQVVDDCIVRSCGDGDGACFEGSDAITPNGDGYNEALIINCSGSISNTLHIFTRWGEQVVEIENYDGEWVGLDRNGNLVGEDTYMWVLEVYPTIGTKEIYKGAVSVLYNLR